MYKIIILNLGSTSTKISLFEDENLFAEHTIRNTKEEMDAAPTQLGQLKLRSKQVTKWIEENNISLEDLDAAVVQTAGTQKCTKSGTYQIGSVLRKDILDCYKPDDVFKHGLCLVVPLLEELMNGRDIPMYIVDSTSVDEFTDVARVSGHPLFKRSSMFHALNQKAVARKAAAMLGKQYSESKIVVAHMGGGVSVGAHHNGRVVDSSNAGTDQDGPFSPTRSGALPMLPLVKMCYSGEYTQKQIEEMILSKGGFQAYTGVTDCRIIEQMAADGDENADLVLKAFSYQVSKEIASQCSVLHFDEVDAIVLTGGIAYSERIVEDIKKSIGAIAPVFVYPGEEESQAMVEGALRVLRKEEEPIVL